MLKQMKNAFNFKNLCNSTGTNKTIQVFKVSTCIFVGMVAELSLL